MCAVAQLQQADVLTAIDSPLTSPPHKTTTTPSHDALILVDWDDTLFATSWLGSWIPDLLHPCTMSTTPAILRAAQSLALDVISFLQHACELGHVIIITNAREGWVEKTAALYAPDVETFLRSHYIPVISACSLFEEAYPHDPTAWKMHAMLEVLRKHYGVMDHVDQAINVISVGDGRAEELAAPAAVAAYAQELTPGSRRTAVKTVRFVQQPLNAQLRLQLGTVTKNLSALVSLDKSVRTILNVAN